MIIQYWNLFDFNDGRNVIKDWADGLPMQKRDRGRLDSKVDMLAKAGDDLPPRLLQPTKSRHIMELALNGQMILRLMLCRGPFSMKNEFTFLFGAVEKNRKYIPKDAPERADGNRTDLILNPSKRCKHEQFSKSSQAII